MHCFSSITTNYLPKARVLAASIKRLHRDATFHLILSDRLPEPRPGDARLFDSIITLEELPIPNLRGWAFQHSVVELCTAVKGAGAQELFHRLGTDRLYYFDPDIVVLSPLDELDAILRQHSILLTPHLTTPEQTLRAVEDNEICALIHGIYNLGFLGVRSTQQGQTFLDWWRQRLQHFCYDDVPGGLFTDQRWIDLAPAFFSDLHIVRDPQYNVATWNMSHRRATGTAPYQILVEGRPLCFFHFSGFDSGAQEIMLELYGSHSPVYEALRRWYIMEYERMGQAEQGKIPCIYDFYDDGERVSRDQQLVYRRRADLQAAFPDPYRTADPGHSYRHWYEIHVGGPRAQSEAAVHEQSARHQHLTSLLADAQRILAQFPAGSAPSRYAQPRAAGQVELCPAS
jgi:hypothetical protein